MSGVEFVMSGIEIVAMVLGSGGVVAGIVNVFKYCNTRKSHKLEIQKLEEEIKSVRNALPERRLENACKLFKLRMESDPDDKMNVEDDYHPFQKNTPIEDPLKHEMSQIRGSDRGVIVVAGPPNAGKTTRTRYIARELFKVEGGGIRGAITFDFDNIVDPFEKVYHSFGVDSKILTHGIASIIPEAAGEEFTLSGGKRPLPVVLIFDQVEKIKDKVGREKLLDFVFDLATKSIKPGVGKDFLSFVLCSDIELAVQLLKLNGRKKIRTPLMKLDIVHEYKWSNVECEGLISKFETQLGNLDPTLRKKLMGYSIQSGTPGFIRDFFTRTNQTDADLERLYKDSVDESAWEEWRDLAALVHS